MYQQSFQFFWPLTEQIPLDLDYTDCERPNLHYNNATTIPQGTFLTVNNTGTTWATISPEFNKLTVDVENITFKQKTKPNLFRRIIYKIIGVNWELK